MTTYETSQPQMTEDELRQARLEAERVAHEPRSLPTLLRELRDEAVTLVQKEFQLARAEIGEKVSRAQTAAVSSAAGAAMLLSGLIVLCIAASAGLYVAFGVWGMNPLIAVWLAPLIVGLLVAFIGMGMVSSAKKVTRAEYWKPERTERSVQETKAWAERKM